MGLQMNAGALNAFLASEFPQVSNDFRVEHVAEEDALIMRLSVTDAHLRPGGTVSGPSMFALADLAIYCAILSRLGPVALAVTTSASFDFMRKPAAGHDLVAQCRLLKLGRTLAVGDVLIFSDGLEQPVARSSMTYAIPPR